MLTVEFRGSAQADEMIEGVRAAFEAGLDELDWSVANTDCLAHTWHESSRIVVTAPPSS